MLNEFCIFNLYLSFKSGSIPRQVGGNRQVIYDRGARQEGTQASYYPFSHYSRTAARYGDRI
jgi:hypothetical protein